MKVNIVRSGFSVLIEFFGYDADEIFAWKIFEDYESREYADSFVGSYENNDVEFHYKTETHAKAGELRARSFLNATKSEEE